METPDPAYATRPPDQLPTSPDPDRDPRPAARRRRRRRAVASLTGSALLVGLLGVAAQATDPGVEVVYVANGFTSADALVGSVLASHSNAPMLTVRTDAIPAATADELTRLAPQRIVVFGGPAAVSDAVFAQLADFATDDTADEVTRLFGEDRFATAAAIAQALPDAVAKAEYAESAGSADTASLAGDAQRLGGLTSADLFGISIPWNAMYVENGSKSDGFGRHHGVVLPNTGAAIAFSFQLPATYPGNRTMIATVQWVADEAVCDLDLRPNATSFQNDASGYLVDGGGASQGLERVGGPAESAGPGELSTMEFEVTGPDGNPTLQAGDVVMLGMFRSTGAADTCTSDVRIQHVEIDLAGFTPVIVGPGELVGG